MTAARTASARSVAEKLRSRRDLRARRKPLHVPLPRAGQRLVEVDDVEDRPAPARGEAAEVAEMRVAAEPHGDAARRRPGEVGGHHRRCAAQEGEGGDGLHADCDRVDRVAVGPPVTVRRAWRRPARVATTGGALRRRRRRFEPGPWHLRSLPMRTHGVSPA
jgi:hypothetical protein